MALLPPRIPAVLSPRADFEPEEFRRQIALRGMDLLWEEAIQCPCGRKLGSVTNITVFALNNQVVTGDHPVECTMCKGSGYIYRAAQEIKGVVQDIRNTNMRTSPQAEYSTGTVRVTLFPETKPALGDRLTVKNSVILLREMRQRSTGVLEELRFPIAAQTQDLSTGPASFQVLDCQKANLNNITGIGDKLIQGVDFTVVNGKINWTIGDTAHTAPVTGAYYTVSYYANPRFVIFDFGHGVRDTWDGMHHPDNDPKFQTMPLLVYARADYLGTDGSRA